MARPRKRAKKETSPLPPESTLLLDQEAESGAEETLSAEALEFIRAIDEYRRTKNRPFPSWTEVLGIVRALGYRTPGSHD
jgi:hypothetical protein